MIRQRARRLEVLASGLIACAGLYAPALAAQSRDMQEGPALVERFRLARVPNVKLQAQRALPGSVKVLAAEAERTNGELRVPLTASDKLSSLSTFRVITGGGKVETAADNKQVVSLPARGTTVLSSSDAQAIAADRNLQVGVKTPLPWTVVDTKPAAEDPARAEVRTARPYLALATAIQWDATAKLHFAQFQLGIDAEAGDDGKLEDPVVATFSVTCSKVQPAKVQLDQIGPAGETTIQVGCDPSAEKDPAKQVLTVRLEQAALAYDFVIPHQVGAPQLIPDAATANGFGLGVLPLTVRNEDEDGTPLAAASELAFHLQSDGASLEPSEVKIPKGETQATVEVRSLSIGDLRVTAVGDLSSEKVGLHFSFPWSFVITTLLGGATGAYLSAQRKTRSSRRRTKLPQTMVEGAMVGLLMVIALLVMPGVAGTIPDSARSSVIGWFLTSALAGFAGIELIERLANRVFGKKPEDASKPQAAQL